LGRLLASALGAPFVELNAEIAKTSGMPVAEVMALYGQEGYRRLERQALEQVAAAHEVVVLAVAGGVVSEPDTFNDLLSRFHTIWLKAKPEEHMARVRNQGDMRPMAGNPAAMDELKAILVSRESLYARAQAEVDTSGKTVEESLKDVLGTIEAAGFLKA
jgi:XRE family aerobic/anaerobic benzoate catabolism transcriptional regulator